MGRLRVTHKKKQKPTLKIDLESYERLMTEAELLNRGYSKIKLGELLSFILDVYFENRDTFSELTGGVIGTQPEFETEQQDKRSKKTKQEIQKSLFKSTKTFSKRERSPTPHN